MQAGKFDIELTQASIICNGNCIVVCRVSVNSPLYALCTTVPFKVKLEKNKFWKKFFKNLFFELDDWNGEFWLNLNQSVQ